MKHIHSITGIKYVPKTYLIEKGAILAFNKSIIYDEQIQCSNHELKTPPTFTRYLIPGDLEQPIHNPYSNRLDGSSEWKYFIDINIGDTITVSGDISEVKIRNGSLGEMCIVTSKLIYVNQKDELTCTQFSTIIHYNRSPNSNINSSDKRYYNTSKNNEIYKIADLDSLKVGDNIPEQLKQPSTRQLVMYAGASRDFYQIHYDQQFAQSIGFPKVIVHGALKAAFLGQMLTNSMDQSAILDELFVRYNAIDFEGCEMICKGTITKIIPSNIDKKIYCDIWIENSDGITTTEGNATIRIR